MLNIAGYVTLRNDNWRDLISPPTRCYNNYACFFLFQHDPEQCTPGGEDGNFIMFARATSGDKRNNNKFSPCSLKAIEPVLNAKARSAKGCFTGNGILSGWIETTVA